MIQGAGMSCSVTPNFTHTLWSYAVKKILVSSGSADENKLLMRKMRGEAALAQ